VSLHLMSVGSYATGRRAIVIDAAQIRTSRLIVPIAPSAASRRPGRRRQRPRPNWMKGNSGTAARPHPPHRPRGVPTEFELSDFARSPRDPHLFDEPGEVVPALYPAHPQLWNRVIGV
jgi:hypothetical protein